MRSLKLPRSPKVIIGLVILSIFVILTIVGPWIAPYDPSATSFLPNMPPSWQNWLGTTSSGEDVLSQLLVGCRVTMVVSFIAGIVATIISIVVGMAAGYIGGRADEGLSLISNVFLAIPGLPLLIVINSYLPSGTQANPLVIGLVIALTGWAWGARVLRAQTLSLRDRDFVEASRIIGESRWRIMFSEIGPNLLPIIASSLLFTILYSVGVYTTLAFLGLTSVTSWNWGTMLYWAQTNNAALANEWWWIAPPGIAIALVGTSLALINFGIDEFINPRLRAAGMSARQRRKSGLTRRPRLGFTPVVTRTTRNEVAGER
jgi:peptide/nickel transport system permease protein